MCKVAVAYITLIVSVCICVTNIVPFSKHVVYPCHFNVLIRQVSVSHGLESKVTTHVFKNATTVNLYT